MRQGRSPRRFGSIVPISASAFRPGPNARASDGASASFSTVSPAGNASHVWRMHSCVPRRDESRRLVGYAFSLLRVFSPISHTRASPLHFHFGRRQFASKALRLKFAALVRAIAERFVCRKPATAQRNHGSARQSVHVALRILDTKLALQPDWPVIDDRYFYTHFPPMVTEAPRSPL